MKTIKQEAKKYKVAFLDKNRNKAKLELEITFRNGYKEFTMCAEIGGSMGQCQHSIVPANEFQKQLLALDEFHLNGMSAGTDEQNKIVKRLKKYDYDKAVKLLKKHKKYTVKHPETGKPYQYGSGWILKALPKDIEVIIEKAIEGILKEEAKRKEVKSPALKLAVTECGGDEDNNIAEMEDDCLIDFIMAKLSIDNDEAVRIAALVKMFNLCEDDLGDIVINDTNVNVQGMDYLFGTDAEMDKKWDEELENYLDECVLPELADNMKRYFDKDSWMDDAKMDSRGHSLNRYDGSEEEVKINNTYFFAYRQ